MIILFLIIVFFVCYFIGYLLAYTILAYLNYIDYYNMEVRTIENHIKDNPDAKPICYETIKSTAKNSLKKNRNSRLIVAALSWLIVVYGILYTVGVGTKKISLSLLFKAKKTINCVFNCIDNEISDSNVGVKK